MKTIELKQITDNVTILAQIITKETEHFPPNTESCNTHSTRSYRQLTRKAYFRVLQWTNHPLFKNKGL
jgi:hypothetical protein